MRAFGEHPAPGAGERQPSAVCGAVAARMSAQEHDQDRRGEHGAEAPPGCLTLRGWQGLAVLPAGGWWRAGVTEPYPDRHCPGGYGYGLI